MHLKNYIDKIRLSKKEIEIKFIYQNNECIKKSTPTPNSKKRNLQNTREAEKSYFYDISSENKAISDPNKAKPHGNKNKHADDLSKPQNEKAEQNQKLTDNFKSTSGAGHDDPLTAGNDTNKNLGKDILKSHEPASKKLVRNLDACANRLVSSERIYLTIRFPITI